MLDKTAPSHAGPRHWGLLGTVLWGAFIAAVFVTLQTVAMIALVSTEITHLTDHELQNLADSVQANGLAISIVTLVTTVVCLPLLLGIVKLKRGSRVSDYLALRAVPLRTLALWSGGLALFLALSDTLSLTVGRPLVPEFMKSVYASADGAWFVWLTLVVAAPLFEESFVRGFLFKGLSSLGTAWAIVITSALWAAVHLQYDLYDMAWIFCLGLLLGAARAMTHSLFTPLLMHSLANLGATIETALVLANGSP